jgi:hypothetical protein
LRAAALAAHGNRYAVDFYRLIESEYFSTWRRRIETHDIPVAAVELPVLIPVCCGSGPALEVKGK